MRVYLETIRTEVGRNIFEHFCEPCCSSHGGAGSYYWAVFSASYVFWVRISRINGIVSDASFDDLCVRCRMARDLGRERTGLHLVVVARFDNDFCASSRVSDRTSGLVPPPTSRCIGARF